MVVVIVAFFLPPVCPEEGGYVGIFGTPLKRATRYTPDLSAVLTICLPFFSFLDGARVARCLSAGAYKSSAGHQDHLQKPVLIRNDKIKWLDFGMTADPQSLQPHPGFVWVKLGYSQTVAWCKVRLTKQRNVDLTTDGLCAMPLNTGWVAVKARRLQDWGKLKKYVPIHKRGDVCPNGVPALVQRDNNDDNLYLEYAVLPCAVLCPVICPSSSFVRKNVTTYLAPPPSPIHTFLKRSFLTDLKKSMHTPPSPRERKFGAMDQKFRNPTKSVKPHRVGAFCMSPRDIDFVPFYWGPPRR